MSTADNKVKLKGNSQCVYFQLETCKQSQLFKLDTREHNEPDKTIF